MGNFMENIILQPQLCLYTFDIWLNHYEDIKFHTLVLNKQAKNILRQFISMETFFSPS